MSRGFVTASAARQSMQSERHGLLHFVRNDGGGLSKGDSPAGCAPASATGAAL